ncbi:hypothetical protein ABG067_007920, partial [Albugo candida]
MQLYSLTPAFKGNDDIRQAELWLKKVMKYKLHYNNNFNDQLFINGITHNFCNNAENWWNTIEDTVPTWDIFVREFKNKFMKVNADEAWDKLKNSKQKNNQSIEGFSGELSILFNTAAYEVEKKRIHMVKENLVLFAGTVEEKAMLFVSVLNRIK